MPSQVVVHPAFSAIGRIRGVCMFGHVRRTAEVTVQVPSVNKTVACLLLFFPLARTTCMEFMDAARRSDVLVFTRVVCMLRCISPLHVDT